MLYLYNAISLFLSFFLSFFLPFFLYIDRCSSIDQYWPNIDKQHKKRHRKNRHAYISHGLNRSAQQRFAVLQYLSLYWWLTRLLLWSKIDGNLFLGRLWLIVFLKKSIERWVRVTTQTQMHPKTILCYLTWVNHLEQNTKWLEQMLETPMLGLNDVVVCHLH